MPCFAAAISFSASAPAWMTLSGLCLFMWSFSLGMGALTFLVAAEVRAFLPLAPSQTALFLLLFLLLLLLLLLLSLLLLVLRPPFLCAVDSALAGLLRVWRSGKSVSLGLYKGC